MMNGERSVEWLNRDTHLTACPHCKRPYRRSAEQNSKMWVLLTIAAKQVEWYGSRLTAEEWKDVFTAALRREKVVPGINGGFVVLGQRTSRMTKDEMSELIELITAFLTGRGIHDDCEHRPLLT